MSRVQQGLITAVIEKTIASSCAAEPANVPRAWPAL
jgi:hypothetical protein